MRSFIKIGLIAMLAIQCMLAYGQTDCPPVTKLKALYASRGDFRLLIDSMFLQLHDLPDGSANPWKHKTIGDLYSFLNQWFYTLPSTSNGLDKIIEFSLLYYHNPYGLRFVNREPGLSWSLDFVVNSGDGNPSYRLW